VTAETSANISHLPNTSANLSRREKAKIAKNQKKKKEQEKELQKSQEKLERKLKEKKQYYSRKYPTKA